ncbi:dihydrofolate reductase [Rhodococcus sp. 27YEA15]|uniref:dihydrofolate reductase family protein n=1 Tax=Rhodococcus sp. 27YEA15 TaxID=3156259 RepID=UPI003C7DAAA1
MSLIRKLALRSRGDFPALPESAPVRPQFTHRRELVRVRKLVLKMSMSLDGFVAGPGGEADRLFRSRGEDSADWVLDTIERAGLHALGRRSYENMAGYWPTATDRMAAPMNTIPKAVFTRQKRYEIQPRGEAAAPGSAAASWASPLVAAENLATDMQRLKQQSGRYILAQGGAGFARSLIQLDLVDEYRLLIHPVVLGAGLPIFTDRQQPMDLELVGTSAFQSGVVAHVYVPRSPSR